jgi:hypothetical protein
MDQSICFGSNHSSDSEDHVLYPSSKGVLAREANSDQFSTSYSTCLLSLTPQCHAVVLQDDLTNDMLSKEPAKKASQSMIFSNTLDPHWSSRTSRLLTRGSVIVVMTRINEKMPKSQTHPGNQSTVHYDFTHRNSITIHDQRPSILHPPKHNVYAVLV